MRARVARPPAPVAIIAAGLFILTGCVPRPASLVTPVPSGSATPSASITASEPGTPSPAGPTASPSFTRPTPGPGPTFLAYTVQPGDTLTSVAREFRTTPRSIAFWSRGEHPSLDPESPTYQPDRLEVGWLLLIIPDTVFDEDSLVDETPAPTAS